MRNVVTVIVVSMVLTACATPTVLDRQQVGDQNLSCLQIEAEIERAKEARRDAREDRGVTPLNVAAGLFFWPALLGTYYNTDEAIEAAGERERYLQVLSDERNCQRLSFGADNSPL